MTTPLLSVEGLSIDYEVGVGRFHALTDVSLTVEAGRVLGVVGETGCGKSTLGHAIPRILPEPPARVRSGRVVFQGVDLYSVPRWKLPLVRGTGIGMIFQEPLNSLNPAFRIYDQLAEAVLIRQRRERGLAPMFRPDQTNPFDYRTPPRAGPKEGLAGPFVGTVALEKIRRPAVPTSGPVRREVLDYLRLVRISDPEAILARFPHELSGGMRQRVMIALALSEKPSLLIADEPTSAVDVTIQAQVLTLMKELISEIRTSILFISHDLGVIAEMADDIGVMYAGRLVECGPAAEIFERPRHPYTKALLRAIPTRYKSDGPLDSILGAVPNLSRLPPGCCFHPRCAIARPECAVDPHPPLTDIGDPSSGTGVTSDRHRSACRFWAEVSGTT
jgi:oligopeptide/dipeptide ABC transporter ATP-binding protein